MKMINVSLSLTVWLLASVLGVAQSSVTPLSEREASQEILALPGLSVFDHLTLNVYNHTVFLEGQVTSPALKDEADRVVRRIEDVHLVNNLVEVLPQSQLDDDIRMAALHAVYGDPNLTRYSLGPNPPIHIIVRDGFVVLEGRVGSEAAFNAADARAASAFGVWGVTNQLQVAR